ncbi:branched-chain amino acid ABC transporter permease [Qiania dongpingensis]|uniref:Branched-chain amino acid ABC transporter permease n=1 Tax=Qiania dongpingensis TaxID=2763669 RepID=A0A7G9G7A4_9FIRM|nr:branched-chain amino acid ABC transporter permease [Qiania dongpingensis]QNM06686.1 branched-chain amino acid ABC transporter permease [Qiania dongpingensis]
MSMLTQLIISGLVLGSIYSLIAMGYSLIYKASGLMTFVQGDILTIGAFVGLTFYRFLKLPYIVSVLLTMVIAFGIGFLLEKGVIRKLLNKNVMAIYIILATIAISYIFQNGAQAIWSSKIEYFPSIFPVDSVTIFGAGVQPEALLCLGAAAVCMVILHIFMTKTKIGTSMRAAAMDPMAAESCGINVSLNTGITWGLAAGIAAIAGIFIGPMYGVYVTLGATIGRKGFSSAVMGGYGNMYGAMVGGLILGLSETLVAGYISSAYKNMFAYILLIVFLFVKPTGIFNERAIQDV